jgi:signal transduction histidine kinase
MLNPGGLETAAAPIDQGDVAVSRSPDPESSPSPAAAEVVSLGGRRGLGPRLLAWALAFPMFVKILGISVLALTVFALVDHLIARQSARVDGSTLLALAVSLGVAAGLAALLAHLVSRPINRLVEAAHGIGEGNFDVRASAICDDEIGHLAAAFNDMARRLALYRRQVQETDRDRRRLLQRIVDSQEEERKHIARELHDQVGQSLMALLLWVQSDFQFRQSPASACPQLVGKIRELADEIHRLTWGMRPSILDHYGLDTALTRYLEEISRKTNIEIDYQSNGPSDAGRLPDRLEVSVYRIVQEAITNVVRHASARRVSVVLLRTRQEVTVLVEDDGCGFDPAVLPAKPRLGLTGIRERATLFGGVCTVESEPGHGTTLRIKIPLDEDLCLSAP